MMLLGGPFPVLPSDRRNKPNHSHVFENRRNRRSLPIAGESGDKVCQFSGQLAAGTTLFLPCLHTRSRTRSLQKNAPASGPHAMLCIKPGCPQRGQRTRVITHIFSDCASMISRSGTRKSFDANMLAVKQGFDFAQRSAGFSEVFRLPLRKDVGNDKAKESGASRMRTSGFGERGKSPSVSPGRDKSAKALANGATTSFPLEKPVDV